MASIRKRGETFTITAYMGYDANGKQIKKTTTYRPPEGVTAGKAEKLAKEYAVKWEDKIRGYTSLDENRIFAELAGWYYKDIAPMKLKPNVLIDNQTMIETYVMPTLSRKKLKDITPTMLDSLFAEMMRNGRVKDTYKLKEGQELPKGNGGGGKKNPLSISAIARETRISRNTIQRLSDGHGIEKANAEMIAEFLGVRFGDMFETAVEDRSLSESSVSRVKRCLSAIFTEAVKKEIMRRNPCTNTTTLSKKSKTPAVYLDETQALQLVTALDEQPNFQFKVMINALLFTGMRGGELCGLQWPDIDFEKNVIYIRRTLAYIRNKGGKKGSAGTLSHYELQTPKTEAGERYVVMPTSLRNLLLEYKQNQADEKKAKGDSWNPHDMLFLTANGNFYGEQYLNAKFKKLAKKLGFADDIHLHSIRHTTASLLINSDVSPKLIAEQLGHSSASITQDIYSHIFKASKARAAQALDIALGGAN